MSTETTLKLDLNVSTRSVNFSANNHGIFSFGFICKFLPSVLICVFYRALTLASAEVGSFASAPDYLYS